MKTISEVKKAVANATPIFYTERTPAYFGVKAYNALVISSSDPLSPMKTYKSLIIMQKFKVTLVKTEKIIGPVSGPMQFIEQNYKTDKPGITINMPPGYSVLSIIQYLPDISQMSYDIKSFDHEKTTD